MTNYNLLTEGNELSYDQQKDKLNYLKEKARLSEANKKSPQCESCSDSLSLSVSIIQPVTYT